VARDGPRSLLLLGLRFKQEWLQTRWRLDPRYGRKRVLDPVFSALPRHEAATNDPGPPTLLVSAKRARHVRRDDRHAVGSVCCFSPPFDSASAILITGKCRSRVTTGKYKKSAAPRPVRLLRLRGRLRPSRGAARLTKRFPREIPVKRSAGTQDHTVSFRTVASTRRLIRR
jgi:hypothetical protein